jgi:hypothetical protein
VAPTLKKAHQTVNLTNDNFCHTWINTEWIYPKISKITNLINMTIHWKALEEHILMVLTVLGWIHYEGSYKFSEFYTKCSRVINRKLPKSTPRQAPQWNKTQNKTKTCVVSNVTCSTSIFENSLNFTSQGPYLRSHCNFVAMQIFC